MSKYSIKPPKGKYTAVPEGYDTSYKTMDSPDMSNYERWEDWGDVKHGIGQAFRPFKEVGDYFLPIEETGQIVQGDVKLNSMNPLTIALGFIPGLKQAKKIGNVLKKGYDKVPGLVKKTGSGLMTNEFLIDPAVNWTTGYRTSVLDALRGGEDEGEYEKTQRLRREENDRIQARREHLGR
jgi:hypothetical protein